MNRMNAKTKSTLTAFRIYPVNLLRPVQRIRILPVLVIVRLKERVAFDLMVGPYSLTGRSVSPLGCPPFQLNMP